LTVDGDASRHPVPGSSPRSRPRRPVAGFPCRSFSSGDSLVESCGDRRSGLDAVHLPRSGVHVERDVVHRDRIRLGGTGAGWRRSRTSRWSPAVSDDGPSPHHVREPGAARGGGGAPVFPTVVLAPLAIAHSEWSSRMRVLVGVIASLPVLAIGAILFDVQAACRCRLPLVPRRLRRHRLGRAVLACATARRLASAASGTSSVLSPSRWWPPARCCSSPAQRHELTIRSSDLG